MTVDELFASMNDNFNASAAAGINAVFQFQFSDADNYHIVIKDSDKDIQKGDHEAPTVTVSTDTSTLLGVVSGTVNGMQAFMTGKLKAKGNMMLAQKLNALFPMGQ